MMQANDPALSEKQNDLLRAEQLKLLHEAILLPISVSVILACVLVAKKTVTNGEQKKTRA